MTEVATAAPCRVDQWTALREALTAHGWTDGRHPQSMTSRGGTVALSWHDGEVDVSGRETSGTWCTLLTARVTSAQQVIDHLVDLRVLPVEAHSVSRAWQGRIAREVAR